MHQHHILCAIAAAFTLIVFTGPVQAETVHCSNDPARMTDADAPCNTAVVAVAPAMSTAKPAARIKAAAVVSSFAAAESARAASWSAPRAADRRFPGDRATLQAAKAALLVSDRESALLRQQMLAKLKT